MNYTTLMLTAFPTKVVNQRCVSEWQKALSCWPQKGTDPQSAWKTTCKKKRPFNQSQCLKRMRAPRSPDQSEQSQDRASYRGNYRNTNISWVNKKIIIIISYCVCKPDSSWRQLFLQELSLWLNTESISKNKHSHFSGSAASWAAWPFYTKLPVSCRWIKKPVWWRGGSESSLPAHHIPRGWKGLLLNWMKEL